MAKSRRKSRHRGRGLQRNLASLLSLTIFSIAILLAMLFFSDNVLSVPIVVVSGVVAFLGVLTISAAILDFFDLSDPSQALGLPSGSVRALIALTLILIFAIMVIFMATNLNKEPIVKTFPKNSTVIYGGQDYKATDGNITILIEPSEAAVDFSKQVLTTISTLVVALAGFYFGTRSVAQAQQSTELPEPGISFNPSSPQTITSGGTLRVIITTTPKNEAIDYEDPKSGEGTITRSKSPNEFVYTAPTVTSLLTVRLRFWMLGYPDDVEELEVRIEP